MRIYENVLAFMESTMVTIELLRAYSSAAELVNDVNGLESRQRCQVLPRADIRLVAA